MTMFVNRLILLAIVAGMCRAEILPSHEPVVGLQTNDTAVIIDAPVDTNGVSRAQLTLMDGSTLFGTLGERELRFDAAMGQTLTLPVELLASLDMDAKKETAEVAFLNGDRLTGRLVPRELEISGLLGTISVPVASIRRMSFNVKCSETDNGLYVVTDKDLLYWNTFDSPERARGPEAGPETVLGDVAFVPGKKGRALHTQGKNDVAAFVLPPYRLKTAGTIEFWAKLDVPDTSFREGVHPRFFWLSRIGHDAGTRLDFSSNNGLGAGGLCSVVQNLSCGTDGGNTYRSILGPDYAGWHHYALVWNRDGLASGDNHAEYIAIYLDGKRVSRQVQRGVPLDLTSLTTAWNTRFIIAPSMYAEGNNVPFAIDDLKIWGVAKTTFDLD